jgi:hypothetical protein
MDRQTERQNQTLEQYLRIYINYPQEDWVTWLPLVGFTYNNSVNASTDQTFCKVEQMVHPNIEEAVCDNPADKFVPNGPDTKVRAGQMAELPVFHEKHWREVTERQ